MYNFEIFNTTQDFKDRMEQLQIKNYLLNVVFISVVLGDSFFVFNYLTNSIKSDTYKKFLIEKNGVAPLATYFYTDYFKKLEELQAKKAVLMEERKQFVGLGNTVQFDYSFENYLLSKSVDLSDFIVTTKAYNYYINMLFIKKLNTLGTEGKKIKLGENEYLLSEVLTKLKSLKQDDLNKLIETPAKSYLEAIKYPLNEINLTLMKNALMGYERNVETAMQIDDSIDVKEVIAKEIIAGHGAIARIGNISMRYPNNDLDLGGFKVFITPKYLEAKEKAKVEFDKNITAGTASLESMKAKEAINKKALITIEKTINLINKLSQKSENYDELVKQIDLELIELGDIK